MLHQSYSSLFICTVLIAGMSAQASADFREKINVEGELELIYLNREPEQDFEPDNGDPNDSDDDIDDDFAADNPRTSTPSNSRLHAFQSTLDLRFELEVVEPIALIGELQLGIDQGQHGDLDTLYLKLDADKVIATAGQLETMFVDADGEFITASLTEFAEIDGAGAHVVVETGDSLAGSLFILDPESVDSNSERTDLSDATIGAALLFGRDREAPVLSIGWVNDLTVVDRQGELSGESAFHIRYVHGVSNGSITLQHVETSVPDPGGGTGRAYGSALEIRFATDPEVSIGIRGEQTRQLYGYPDRRYSLLVEKRLSDKSVLRLETLFGRIDTTTVLSRRFTGVAASFNLEF